MFYFKTVSQCSIVDCKIAARLLRSIRTKTIATMNTCPDALPLWRRLAMPTLRWRITRTSHLLSPALQSHTRLIPATRVSSMTVMKATCPDPTSLLLVNRNIRSSNNRKGRELNSKPSIISTTYMQPTIACRAAVEMAVVEMGAIGMRNRVAQCRIS